MSAERKQRSNSGNLMAQMRKEDDKFYKSIYGGFKEEEYNSDYVAGKYRADLEDSNFNLDYEPVSYRDEEEETRKRFNRIQERYKPIEVERQEIEPVERTTKDPLLGFYSIAASTNNINIAVNQPKEKEEDYIDGSASPEMTLSQDLRQDLSQILRREEEILAGVDDFTSMEPEAEPPEEIQDIEPIINVDEDTSVEDLRIKAKKSEKKKPKKQNTKRKNKRKRFDDDSSGDEYVYKPRRGEVPCARTYTLRSSSKPGL